MSNNDENRFLTLDAPFADELMIAEFSGTEEISSPFSFEIGAYSPDRNILYEDALGQSVTVSLLLANDERRNFHGIISRFSQAQGGQDEAEHAYQLSYYTFTVVPWLWLLTRYTNSRIFQGRSVPQILEQLFNDRGFSGQYELRLRGTYEPRDFCVQYRESDLNFVSRLMEEEGIYYFFEHEQQRHTMVVTNHPAELLPCPHQESARCDPTPQALTGEDVITSFDKTQVIRSGKFIHKDFYFVTPTTDLKAEAPSPSRVARGELYDYPGLYTTKARGSGLASLRIEEEEAQAVLMHGASTCRDFAAGRKVRVEGHYRDDMADLDCALVSVSHMATYPVGTSGTHASRGPESYSNSFSCIPAEVPYRPPRNTTKPVVQGTQTAIVVGPPGEEIHTNEHGQIKVQFHWDLEGTMDDKSSCWIRVAQLWSGPSWGGIIIPRIGQEVVVDFLEGDPDRPLVIGCVYNGNNRAPFGLPAEAIVSGMKSNSSPGGGGYNEISMNDTKGKEAITIHGQYDMNTTVENDRTTTIVGGNDTLKVQAGTQSQTIKGNASLTVQAGARTVDVTGGNYSATSSLAVKLHGKGAGVTVTGDSSGVNIIGNGGPGVLVSGDGGPGAKVEGKPNFEAVGASKAIISSPDIDIGDGTIKIHGSKIELVTGGGSVVIDGSGVSISGPTVKSAADGANQITGGVVKIN